ncbi:MAG: hypothetical protein AAGK78_09430, partial [Planctomycetota bacterium]
LADEKGRPVIRLLLCLLVLTASASVLLLLRQQRIQLRYECDRIHAAMLEVQTDLWNQQLSVATATAPAALDATLASHIQRAERARQRESRRRVEAGDEWSNAWSELPDRLDEQVQSWGDLLAE